MSGCERRCKFRLGGHFSAEHEESPTWPKKRLDGVQQSAVRPDGSDRDNVGGFVKFGAWQEFLEAAILDGAALNRQLAKHLAEERTFANLHLHHDQPQPWAGEHEGNRRRAAAASNVDGQFVADLHPPGRQNWFHNQPIHRIVGQRVDRQRGEINFAIPLGQELNVGCQVGEHIRRGLRAGLRQAAGESVQCLALSHEPILSSRSAAREARGDDRDGGRGDAGDSTGLAESRGTDRRQPLDHLAGQAGNTGVFEVGRNHALTL